jgi:flagellar biosynthetic protein FliR
MDLLDVYREQFSEFLVVFSRVGGMVATIPFLGAANIPRIIKSWMALILALVFTAILYPMDITYATTTAGIIAQLSGEAVIGLAIGFSASIIFEIAIFAGFLMDYMIGFSFITIVDPGTGASISLFAFLYSLLSLIVFLGVDGHHILIEVMVRSYELIPAFGAQLTDFSIRHIVGMFGAIFSTGFRMAAPIFVVMFIVDFSFGMIGKTVPQMQILMVGFPVKISIGLTVMAVAIKPIMAFMLMLFESYREALFWLMKYWGDGS